MNKPIKRIMAILLAITVIFSILSLDVFATETVASVPIRLTVANEYRSISVTVPASMPIEISNGVVITADNAKITNNSKYGTVKVTDVYVKQGTYKIGSYTNFSGKKTVALKINGISTTGAGSLKLTDTAFPEILPEGSMNLKYFAKVSNDCSSMKNSEIAQVIFTISIVD